MRPTTNDITSLTSCHPVHDDLSRFSLKDYENLHNDNVDCCLLDTCMGNGEQKLRWKKWEESELAALAALMRRRQQENICGTLSSHLIGKGRKKLKRLHSK